MRVLFLTSDDFVTGLTSDDGFQIGRISADTIALLIAATIGGVMVGTAWGVLRMMLRGPMWLVAVGLAVSLGMGAGAVIVNTEGVDFRLLSPLWLAVTLFVVLPGAWGATVVALTARLLHSPMFFSTPLPGVDERPLGRLGSAAAWSLLAVMTVAGVIDLSSDYADLERLR